MKTNNSYRQEKKIPIPWRLYTLIYLIVLVAAAFMAYIIQQTNNIFKTHNPWLMKISDIELQVTTAHLKFEDSLRGNRNEKIESSRQLLDEVEETIQSLVEKNHGGDKHFHSNSELAASKASDRFHFSHASHAFLTIKEPMEQALRLVSELKDSLDAAGFGNEDGRHFKVIYADIMELTRRIKQTIRESRSEHFGDFRRVQTFLNFGFLILGGLFCLILHRFERLKTKALRSALQGKEALAKAHSDLERRVEERTEELAEANKVLSWQISERLFAEEALRKSKKQLSDILDAMPDIIIIVDIDDNIVWSNPVALKYFGSDPLGKKYFEVFNALQEPFRSSCLQQCLRDGYSRDEEIEVMGNDGNRISLSCTARVMTQSESGLAQSSIMICRDITEKKMLRAEAARTGQLASIGELAAGVAHEINNPINGIINCAQLLIDDDVPDSETELYKKIRQEGRRISMIVRNLLSFAGGHQETAVLIQINSLISDSLSLSGTQIREDGIELNVEIPPDLPEIRIRRTQIQQVVLNIISNARYSLNQKYPQRHPQKALQISSRLVKTNEKEYVRVIFHDTGNGIAKDILNRICDPFFTSKPAGKGTGLGLSISQSIINEHKGRLLFQSVEGEFCKVIVDLPVSTDKK